MAEKSENIQRGCKMEKKKNFDGMGVFITANVNRQSPHAELAAGARDELWSPQTISLISMALDIQAYINTFPRRM